MVDQDRALKVENEVAEDFVVLKTFCIDLCDTRNTAFRTGSHLQLRLCYSSRSVCSEDTIVARIRVDYERPRSDVTRDVTRA